MTRSCPQHCGRLVTAAIFISFGVVQLIAGIILLKSRYVYLLSGPNIWTALANISSGGLLGLSAGVWEKISKSSPKHAIRRNILSALVASVLLINSTTAIILILGEGNTLLSIQLEKSKTDTTAPYSASEILAYAYSASVCSPIICIVIATAFLAEMIFPKVRKSFRIRRVLDKDSNTFSWVYKTDRGLPKPDPEVVRKAMSTSRSSLSSSSSDSSCSPAVVRRKLDVETSLSKRIVPLPRQASVFGKSTDRPSRVSFVGDYATNDSLLRDIEMGDLQDRMKPRLKKRGDLFRLSYANEINECGTDLNASISSRKSDRPVHLVKKRRRGVKEIGNPDLVESREISQSVPQDVQLYEVSRYETAPLYSRKISQTLPRVNPNQPDLQEGIGCKTVPDLQAYITSSQLFHRMKNRQSVPEVDHGGKMNIQHLDLDASVSSRNFRQPVSDDAQYERNRKASDLNQSTSVSRKSSQPVPEIDYNHGGEMHIEDLDAPILSRKFSQLIHEVKGRQLGSEKDKFYESNRNPSDPNPSTSYRTTSPEDLQSPDVFESFHENLRGHQSLRKTSTTTNLSQSNLEDSSLNHSNLHKTLSSGHSNGDEDFAGEVVPIRIDTLPRRKLPAKLVPVAAPVVTSAAGFRSLRRLKTAKWKDDAVAGTSSFKGGRGAKLRSKSTGSYPSEKPLEAIPRKAVSVEAHESSLQLSPAHTSGYMSNGDENLEITLGTSSMTSPGCSSYPSKRRKYRSVRRKNHDQQRKLKAEEIDDVVKQMIGNEQVLSDETLEKLYKLILYRRSLLSP